MIARYDIAVISKIWSLSQKYQYFLTVEQALLESLESFEIIPQGVSKALEDVIIKPERIDELDKELKHDVIAFCTSITEQMPEEFRAYFHYGVTSSDIIDTALSLQIRDSLNEVHLVLDKVISSLDKQVEKSKHILGLGRSHGIYAEPMIFAQKWLGHLAEFKRRKKSLQAIELTAQFSGAVGNYSVLNPDIEAKACGKLKLSVEPCSTQVIPRDRIAAIVNEFSLIACAVERLAIEIRHLHHSDIDEVCEGFSQNQKGSSTMPHKKNPVSSENLSGLSRMLRSFSQVSYDNCLLWHERDISHSSNERMYLPDMFGLAYYMLNRLSKTLDDLTYNEEKIEAKVESHPKVFSSLILHQLIRETDISREDLYRVVQKACFENQSLEDISKSVHEQTGYDLNLNIESVKAKYFENFQKVYQRVKETK